jgi:toxin FitB
MYLVDTNVLSAGAPARVPTHESLVLWMEEKSEELYLSVITIAEVEAGIAKAQRLGATNKAERLAAWLDTILHLYGSRILPFDIGVARIVGRLSEQVRGLGQAPGFPDIAIAATAQVHGLTVLTQNIRHFLFMGVRVHDPFVRLPSDSP